MNTINILNFGISSWLFIPLVYFVWVSVWLFLKRLLFFFVRKYAHKTKTKLDDIFIRSFDLPATLFIFTSGGVIVEKILPFTLNTQLTNFFVIVLKAVTIIAVVLFADRFINGLIREYSHKIEILQASEGVARTVVRLVVISLGFLILLDSFGVSITPVLASLGIGSLAVALALQPTLENFFAGIQIVIDKPFKEGQFIRLESGDEGYVHKIGWRSTWIRMLPNNMVVIPNKNLVNAQITNYYYPDKELAVLVQVGVHYGSDLKEVERVTIEVAREVMEEVAGGVPNFEPFVRYHTFADFSVNFTVILRAKEFVDQYLVKHEFIKRLHQRYQEEGIVIPFPIEAVNLEQEEKFAKMLQNHQQEQLLNKKGIR